jgi:hypothetical protein
VTDRFISSIAVETRGAHEHVTVFIRGRNVGTLVCGDGEGAALAATLQGASLFSIDVSGLDKGDPSGREREDWLMMAGAWLDVEKIDAPRGFVARVVLRLLKALDAAEERAGKAEALLAEAGAALGDGARVIRENVVARACPDEWLIKDFNALYRAAQRLVTVEPDLRGNVDFAPFDALDALVTRLAPAFTLTESVRSHARETGTIAPPTGQALADYERTKRMGEGD